MIERACACGHVFRLEKAPPDTVCVCPKCGAVTRIDDRTSASATSQAADKPLKPLWSVMGESPPPPPPTSSMSRPKGLWNVMGTAPATKQGGPESTAVAKVVPPAPPTPPAAVARESEDFLPIGDDPSIVTDIEVDAVVSSAGDRAGRSRQALWSLGLGGVSLALSLLSVVPAVWAKFPAMVVGFSALLLGFFASQEIRQSRGRQTGTALALAGIVCGVLGMFFGPVVISPLVKPRAKESPRKSVTIRPSKPTIAAPTHKQFAPLV